MSTPQGIKESDGNLLAGSGVGDFGIMCGGMAGLSLGKTDGLFVGVAKGWGKGAVMTHSVAGLDKLQAREEHATAMPQ